MTSFNFSEQPNSQAPFGGFNFGQTSTSASIFTGQPALGTTAFGTAAPFGGGAQTASSFSTLGYPTSSTTGFSFGQTAPSTSSGFSFGNFGTSAPASSLTLGSGTSLLPTATTATVGLGGVDVQTSSGGDGSNLSSKKDFKAAKESQIPNEISITVECFKKYVKEQKAIREEMSRVSSKSIVRVQELVTALRQQLSVVSNGLQRNAIAIAKLKEESNEELKNAEIAQRTKGAPVSLQYENNTPTEYFHNLASSFEKQMQSYRQQIEQLERHLLSLSQPYTLTPNEWVAIRRHLHDTFVTLASQLQTVHQEVQVCKEHLLTHQKLNQTDVRNLYETCKDMVPQKHLPDCVTYGPSPFAAMQSAVGKAIKGFNRSQQLPGFAGSMGLSSLQSSSSSPFKPLGFSSNGVAAASPFGSPLDPQKPFQLQKPPAGNKRGKRWTST